MISEPTELRLGRNLASSNSNLSPFRPSIPSSILGVLKKSEIFRSHVYGVAATDGGKERHALLFAEKEDAVVGALETGKD